MATQQVGEQLVVGALVQWERGKEYGVIATIENNRITVQWDASESEQPPVFPATNPPLSRVDFTGRPVIWKDTGGIVAVLRPVPSMSPTWECYVIRGERAGQEINIPEAALRPRPITNPVERFHAGKIGSTKRHLLHQATIKYQLENLQHELVSLSRAQVDLKPHQVAVAHRVVSNYPHRFLLCDEVGLGKTIEAGMVIKELKSRGGAQRVLILCPPNLVGQWRYEMKTKFNEDFAELNTATVRIIQGNPFNHPDYPNVVCSSRWASDRRGGRADRCAEADWDLIIVDEAHHARRHRDGGTTQLYRLVSKLAGEEQHHARSMLFLTATPLQLHSDELYSLVELLDPVIFSSGANFNYHQAEMPSLSRLVAALDLVNRGEPLPGFNKEQAAEQVSEWLEVDADEVQGCLSPGDEKLSEIIDRLMAMHRLSEVLIRNRKDVIGGFQPRSAVRWEVELTLEEEAALAAVLEYVNDGYQFATDTQSNSIGFLMSTFQKMAASSTAAILDSLQRRREKIASSVDTQIMSADEMDQVLEGEGTAADIINAVEVAAANSETELMLLDKAVTALEAVEVDSKAQTLLERLTTELFTREPEGKVLIFTQFRETQRHLARLLNDREWGVNLFHGQLNSKEKDSAIERFRDSAGPQILISTEAGGEGRNLQFCHLMVNYDLPWNPMKVEQRIGRIDRINQEHPIEIFNLSVKDTIEDRVLDILEKRIEIFKRNVGGLGPIIEDLENRLRRVFANPNELHEVALGEIEIAIEKQIQGATEVGQDFDYFIMDAKSFPREVAERISGEAAAFDYSLFEQFIQNLLEDVNTRVDRQLDRCELRFWGDFYDANRQRLFPKGQRMSAVLRPDRSVDAQEVELMTFGHEVVEALVERVLDPEYEGTTGTRRIPANDDLAATSGWLFLYQFTVPGIRNTEYLEPVFVSDGGEVSEAIGRLLLDRACGFSGEETIPAENITANPDQAAQLANEFAVGKIGTLQDAATSQAGGRIDNEVSRLTNYYANKEQSANERVEATRATLNRIRESNEPEQLRIVPVWEANLRRDESYAQNLGEERRRRIAEAERHRYPQVSWALKSLGRIEVVAGE